MKYLDLKLRKWVLPVLGLLVIFAPLHSKGIAIIALSLVFLGTQPVTKVELNNLDRFERIANWALTGFASAAFIIIFYMEFIAVHMK